MKIQLLITIMCAIVVSGCLEKEETVTKNSSKSSTSTNDTSGNESTDENNSSENDSSVITYTSKVTSSLIHTCFIMDSGQTKCWGLNYDGGFGNAVTSTALIYTPPTLISGNYNFIDIDSYFYSSCAVADNYKIYCWGRNNTGQLGDGTSILRNIPTQINDNSNYIQVAVGETFACGITDQNAIKCWGDGYKGQMGNGTYNASSSPTPISVNDTFIQVTAGPEFACGLVNTGAVWCWGDNNFGEVGAVGGSHPNDKRSVPVNADSAYSYQYISAGDKHVCGVTQTGSIRCWGLAILGDGNASTSTYNAVDVDSTDEFKTVHSGNGTTCALTTSNEVKCWGGGGVGALGNGSTSSSLVPAAISGGLTFKYLNANTTSSFCGVTFADKLYCWGLNDYGQIGDGTTTNSLVPLEITSYQ